MKSILITGAAGKVGKILRKGLRDRFVLRLGDIAPLGETRKNEQIVSGDILDFESLKKSMKGVDCVVHLAGQPVEMAWEKILPANIQGTYNVFEAARQTGVKRVIYISSCHAIGFYRLENTLDATALPRPSGLYGVSKVFGETLGRLYADKHGLSVACLRLGVADRPPKTFHDLIIWLSERDLVHLLDCCIETPQYHFVIVYGVSANTRKKWDNSHASFLNFDPQDNSEIYSKDCVSEGDPIAEQFHGGTFCSFEFNGDLSQII